MKTHLEEGFTLPHSFHMDSSRTPGTLLGFYLDSRYISGRVIWLETPAKLNLESSGTPAGIPGRIQGFYQEFQGLPVPGLNRVWLESRSSPCLHQEFPVTWPCTDCWCINKYPIYGGLCFCLSHISLFVHWPYLYLFFSHFGYFWRGYCYVWNFILQISHELSTYGKSIFTHWVVQSLSTLLVQSCDTISLYRSIWNNHA